MMKLMKLMKLMKPRLGGDREVSGVNDIMV